MNFNCLYLMIILVFIFLRGYPISPLYGGLVQKYKIKEYEL